MADVEYILGTLEYMRFDLTASAPGQTFTSSEWTAQVALAPVEDTFDADTATWYDATLQTVSSVDYVILLAGTGQTCDPAAGRYRAFVKLTKTSGGVEIPVIKAAGTVSWVAG